MLRRHKTLFVFYVITALLLIFVGPVIINYSFTCSSKTVNTFLQEKDVLSYYTSLLSLAVTITTFVLAYNHTIEKIVHNQVYEKTVQRYNQIKKQIDECLAKMHPYQLKRYSIVTDEKNHILLLFHNLEEYKLDLLVLVDTICCEAEQNQDDYAKKEITVFTEQLDAFRKELIDLTDEYLLFYKKAISSGITKDEYCDKLEYLDCEIIRLQEKYKKLHSSEVSVFNLIFNRIAESYPSERPSQMRSRVETYSKGKTGYKPG